MGKVYTFLRFVPFTENCTRIRVSMTEADSSHVMSPAERKDSLSVLRREGSRFVVYTLPWYEQEFLTSVDKPLREPNYAAPLNAMRNLSTKAIVNA